MLHFNSLFQVAIVRYGPSGQEGGTSCSQNEEHRSKHKTCIHLKMWKKKRKTTNYLCMRSAVLLMSVQKYQHRYL